MSLQLIIGLETGIVTIQGLASTCFVRNIITIIMTAGNAGASSHSLYTVEGYGESRPVAAKARADGSDNPEGRSLRVEVKIQTSK